MQASRIWTYQSYITSCLQTLPDAWKSLGNEFSAPPHALGKADESGWPRWAAAQCRSACWGLGLGQVLPWDAGNWSAKIGNDPNGSADSARHLSFRMESSETHTTGLLSPSDCDECVCAIVVSSPALLQNIKEDVGRASHSSVVLAILKVVWLLITTRSSSTSSTTHHHQERWRCIAFCWDGTER